MKIINTHTHLTKKDVEGMKKGDIDDIQRDMKEGNISSVLLFYSQECEKGVEYTLDELIEIIKRDNHFAIIYSINFNSSLKEQEKEIEYLFKNELIKGIKILLGYHEIMPTDKKLFPFYKLCEKYGYPVIFHTGDTLGPKAKLIYSHPLNVDSLAADFPNLKIILAHVGNPWTIDAAEVIYKNPNVYGDISGLFLDSIGGRYEELMLKRLNELITYCGKNKLLFGTDFPLIDSKSYVKFANKLDLDKDGKEFLFHKNAEELFRLK